MRDLLGGFAMLRKIVLFLLLAALARGSPTMRR
jgi:hypothetical protein